MGIMDVPAKNHTDITEASDLTEWGTIRWILFIPNSQAIGRISFTSLKTLQTILSVNPQ
jgi:hypothetical protein